MTQQPTCEDRILDHLNGRMADIGALADIVDAYGSAELAQALEDSATRETFCELATREMFAGDVPEPCRADDIAAMDAETLETLLEDFDVDTLREAAEQRMDELPLSVSAHTVFRVDLSTGGPGDWLEIECTGDRPLYEPAGDGEHYEVIGITYHFNDWFDHAQRTLEGRDLEVAERFAQRVVPELVG